MKYTVGYTITKVEEEIIEANSIDEAKEKWEQMGYDAELFFIRDEQGKEIIYD